MNASDGSSVVRAIRRSRTRLATAAADSYFVTDARRVRQRFGFAMEGSRAATTAASAGDAIGRWIRTSWLYRWLTAEPEPEVIVIDLRETYTVGPVLAVLDRAVAWAAPRWRGSPLRRVLPRWTAAVEAAPVRVAGWFLVVALVASLAAGLAGGERPTGPLLIGLGLALLATRERRSAAELRETWAGRALAALLVPPDVPDDEPDQPRESTSERDRESAPEPPARREK